MAVVSSCRGMLGEVPQRAQPLSLVAGIQLGTLRRMPVLNRRKAGMTSSPHGRYVQGYTRTTMAGTKGREEGRTGKNRKAGPRPDCGLKLGYMKWEALVSVDQHAAVNTFPGLVHTARHTTKVGSSRSGWANRREVGGEGRAGDWGEVVTR